MHSRKRLKRRLEKSGRRARKHDRDLPSSDLSPSPKPLTVQGRFSRRRRRHQMKRQMQSGYHLFGTSEPDETTDAAIPALPQSAEEADVVLAAERGAHLSSRRVKHKQTSSDSEALTAWDQILRETSWRRERSESEYSSEMTTGMSPRSLEWSGGDHHEVPFVHNYRQGNRRFSKGFSHGNGYSKKTNHNIEGSVRLASDRSIPPSEVGSGSNSDDSRVSHHHQQSMDQLWSYEQYTQTMKSEGVDVTLSMIRKHLSARGSKRGLQQIARTVRDAQAPRLRKKSLHRELVLFGHRAW